MRGAMWAEHINDCGVAFTGAAAPFTARIGATARYACRSFPGERIDTMDRGGPGRIFVILGAVSGFLGVGAGAFGAHALKARLAPDLLAIFDTGARYQLVHALALLAVAWACERWPGAALRWAGWRFVAGTVLFSGSLYALALSGVRGLGAVTPVGGVAFLAGWALLAWAAWRAGR
jgi:uncharacterized membrane protein YgdD (TMEM256/DUF423 family)